MKITEQQNEIGSKWFRPAESKERVGVSRGTIYSLIKRGLVKSISLRGKGQKQATRLVSLDSVHEYYERLATEQTQSEGGEL